MKSHDINIRLATADDAEELLRVYRPYVEETAITFEITVPTVEEFRTRIEKILKKHPYLAAVSDHGITGYAYAAPFKGREAFDWAVETSIYVDREWHGCGIGTALYQELERWLNAQNILNLNACITYPNPDSIRFHRGFGYRETAHFTKCGYKLGAWHDVIWMEKLLGRHKNPPNPVLPMEDLIQRMNAGRMPRP